MDRLWTDVLRHTGWFQILNTPPTNPPRRHNTMAFDQELEFRPLKGGFVSHKFSIPWMDVNQFYGHPVLVYANDPESIPHGDRVWPHASHPRFAQRCTCMAMVWNTGRSELERYSFDRKVGIDVPDHTTVLTDDGHEGHFETLRPTIHRGDGRPAVLIVSGLKKAYNQGRLHRNERLPALKADTIIAKWYDHNVMYRSNGPSQILIQGYKEYHTNGVFERATYDSVQIEWGLAADPDPGYGKTNPLAVRYFEDVQDECHYAARNRS